MIGIPSRDPFFVTQYLERHSVSDQRMKKLLSLREGLRVMMQSKHATAFLLIVTGCINIQEDTSRGENLGRGNSQKNQLLTS